MNAQRQLCAHEGQEAAFTVSWGGNLPSEANEKRIQSRDAQRWEKTQEGTVDQARMASHNPLGPYRSGKRKRPKVGGDLAGKWVLGDLLKILGGLKEALAQLPRLA